VVTMALSSIISEIKRDIGEKSQYFHTAPAFDVLVRRKIYNKLWVHQAVKTFDDIAVWIHTGV